MVQHTTAMTLDLTFEAGKGEDNRAASNLRPICCGLPDNPDTDRTRLPVGQTAWRIAVNTEGIYQLDYATLQAAGMPVDSIDPAHLTLLWNGRPVALQFVGNADAVFGPGEAIRFYGQPFQAPRTEKQYINDNIYWLWADPAATHLRVASVPNAASGTLVSAFPDSVTAEQDLLHNATYTTNWALSPNEPDAWYWAALYKTTAPPASFQFTVPLNHPALPAPDATVTTEVLGNADQSHLIRAALATAPATTGEVSFFGYRNDNAVFAAPATALLHGDNTVIVTNASSGASRARLNRITIDYWRQLIAVQDRLGFSHPDNGPLEFQVSGFAGNSPVVWNVSNPLMPAAVTLLPGDVAEVRAPEDGYTYRIAGNNSADTRYFAASTNGLLSPLSVTPYDVVELDPPGGADWVSITWHEFIPAAQRLALHRSQPAHGGLITHVVDVADVIAQYGYGFPSPTGIRNFLGYAITHWDNTPEYALLFGDSSISPRGTPCPLCNWGSPEPNLVPTYLLFLDRFLGQIPSDYPFQLLVGGDEEPDIAVGRIASSNVQQANNTVDKTILYETNQIDPEEYLKNILFVSDSTDAGGNFCASSQQIGNSLPDEYQVQYHCMPDKTLDSRADARDFIFDNVNNTGISILNYRGHGDIQYWGSGGSQMLNVGHAPQWDNADRPIIIITADCLDGNFVWGGRPAISETYHAIANGGTAAHWSSSGLGFNYEYSVLHQGFYTGLFDNGLTKIGDAVSFAKSVYVNTTFASGTQYHPATLYAMTLQGDPAMEVLQVTQPTAVGLSGQAVAAPTAWLPAVVLLFLVGLVWATRRVSADTRLPR
jgi:hypothetical protein